MLKPVEKFAPPMPTAAPNAEQILHALPDPVLVVDGEDNLVAMNAAAEQFFQSSQVVLLGSNLQDLIPHDSPILSLAARVRKRGNSMTEYGVRLRTPRIGSVWMSVDAAAIADRPRHVVLVLQPQSIAGKIDRSLVQQGATRSVTALTAMLAHEVKNPLSGIRGSAQLLESLVPPEDRSLCRLIIEETDRIVKLIDRMEVFSDRPNLDERGPVNIHEVLEHVIRLARNGFGSSMRFVEQYDPSLPPVFGHRDQLIQIFLNLIKNACEACDPADGEIVVRTAYRHGVRLAVPGAETRTHLPLVVEVQDNGTGVSEGLRQHLFDPFITTKPGGTGLGLPLVAKLVGDHGGVIDMESQPRRTVFSVMLPILRDAEPPRKKD